MQRIDFSLHTFECVLLKELIKQRKMPRHPLFEDPERALNRTMDFVVYITCLYGVVIWLAYEFWRYVRDYRRAMAVLALSYVVFVFLSTVRLNSQYSRYAATAYT